MLCEAFPYRCESGWLACDPDVAHCAVVAARELCVPRLILTRFCFLSRGSSEDRPHPRARELKALSVTPVATSTLLTLLLPCQTSAQVVCQPHRMRGRAAPVTCHAAGVQFHHAEVIFPTPGVIFHRTGVIFHPSKVIFHHAEVALPPAGVAFRRSGGSCRRAGRAVLSPDELSELRRDSFHSGQTT